MEKEAAREALRDMVKAELQPLVEAQIANAKGIKYLVVRQKSTGRFLRRYEAGSRLDTDTEVIEVWEKDPSVQAFMDLMNRTLDKPAEHVSMDATLTVDVSERLNAARRRQNEKLKRG